MNLRDSFLLLNTERKHMCIRQEVYDMMQTGSAAYAVDFILYEQIFTYYVNIEKEKNRDD